MEQILQPTTITCHNCHTPTRPTSYDVRKENEIVTEGQWRCPQCGTFLKRGVFKVTPIVK